MLADLQTQETNQLTAPAALLWNLWLPEAMLPKGYSQPMIWYSRKTKAGSWLGDTKLLWQTTLAQGLSKILLNLPETVRQSGHFHRTFSPFLLYYVSNLHALQSDDLTEPSPILSQFRHTDLGASLHCSPFFLRGKPMEFNGMNELQPIFFFPFLFFFPADP